MIDEYKPLWICLLSADSTSISESLYKINVINDAQFKYLKYFVIGILHFYILENYNY